MTDQRVRAVRLAKLLLTSVLFFVLIGPTVGAIVFLPDIGLTVFMVAHGVGFIPALLTGILNAMLIMMGLVRSFSLIGRLLHAFVGGLCGFLITVLFLDYNSDWWLILRTSDWYDFWYSFKRSYVELSMAGLLAGAVCSFIFNPWAQRRYVP